MTDATRCGHFFRFIGLADEAQTYIMQTFLWPLSVSHVTPDVASCGSVIGIPTWAHVRLTKVSFGVWRLAVRYQMFQEMYCPHLRGIWQSTRRHVPDYNNRHSFCRKNLKSRINVVSFTSFSRFVSGRCCLTTSCCRTFSVRYVYTASSLVQAFQVTLEIPKCCGHTLSFPSTLPTVG